MRNLIWSDEFDYTGAPDAGKWNTVTGGGGFGNNEIQFYTDRTDSETANAYVSDGKLRIKVRNEVYENRKQTSARLNTAGKFSFRYGYIEVRAKLPKGKGTWPAIWMMSDKVMEGVKWPDCGEIDIMEHTGSRPDIIHFSLHSETQNHKINTELTKVVSVKGVMDDFHTYSLDWKPESLTFYVDGVETACFDKSAATSWPFDDAFFIILNVAYGGFFAGETDDSELPDCMEVEYVRVYE